MIINENMIHTLQEYDISFSIQRLYYSFYHHKNNFKTISTNETPSSLTNRNTWSYLKNTWDYIIVADIYQCPWIDHVCVWIIFNSYNCVMCYFRWWRNNWSEIPRLSSRWCHCDSSLWLFNDLWCSSFVRKLHSQWKCSNW